MGKEVLESEEKERRNHVAWKGEQQMQYDSWLIGLLEDEFNMRPVNTILGLQPCSSFGYRPGMGGTLDLTRLVVYQTSMT